jgi:radical SAM superfamily enzyme YgiQ (UPF0313 family)
MSMTTANQDGGARILIFNYTGFPDYTSYFLADNGIAYLASCLQADRHEVVIADYVTPDTAQRLFHPIVAEKVPGLRRRVRAETIEFGSPRPGTLEEAFATDEVIDDLNRRVALEIADELTETIRARRINLLAVKLWSQPSIRDVRAILAVLRERFPHLRIIAGGGHIDYFQQRVLSDFTMLDAAGIGDGEVALRGFAAWVAGRIPALNDVPNLIYRDQQEIRTTGQRENTEFADSAIFPNFDAGTYPAAAAADQKMLTIPFEDSRGCQFRCGFCIHPIKSGGLRLRRVEHVLDELQYLNERYGFINFTGSGSNTPFSHACKLYQGMRDRGLDLAVNFFQSLRDFRINKADAMKAAHIPLLWVGIESAEQDLLQITYDKRRDMDKTRQVCEFLNEHRIGYIMSLIYPSPGESESSRQATIDFVREVGLGHVVVYPPLLQPRTPWMHHRDITWLDRELFLSVSQSGLEELENRVLPPMVRSAELNASVLMNGKPYRQIYYESLLFRHHLDIVCGGDRGYKREFHFTDELAPFMRQLNDSFGIVDECLETGDFDRARASLADFNELATAGSVHRTRLITSQRGRAARIPRQPGVPKVVIRSGGPA